MSRFVSALGTTLLIFGVLGFTWLLVGPSPEDIFQGPARPVATITRTEPTDIPVSNQVSWV